MKKAVLGLFASIALILGVGAMGNTAVAAPYPSTVKTYSIITRTASTTEGKSFTTKVIVTAGNAVVDEGKVTIVFGGRKFYGNVNNGSARIKVKAPKVSKTQKKTMKAAYKPSSKSVYKSSTTTTKITVKNKK
jgi:hypothetical protein